MQIFISGSIAYDRIMTFPGKFENSILPEKLHILNVCFLVDNLIERFGGTAGNIAYTLSLLGERAVILAAVGNDFDRYEKRLAQLELPMNGIRKIDETPTAGCYITTDEANNQITIFNPAAMNYTTDFDFSNVDPKNAIAIVSPGCLKDMSEYPRRYKAAGIPYILDPGQNIPAFPGEELTEMIDGSEILISNDYELEMICEFTKLTKTELQAKAKIVITTLGEDGARISTGERDVHIPAIKVSGVADPTGAGDAFRSGLLKGLVMGKDIVEAAKIGSVTAGYSVEKEGTQEHTFTEDEFWARYQKNYG